MWTNNSVNELHLGISTAFAPHGTVGPVGETQIIAGNRRSTVNSACNTWISRSAVHFHVESVEIARKSPGLTFVHEPTVERHVVQTYGNSQKSSPRRSEVQADACTCTRYRTTWDSRRLNPPGCVSASPTVMNTLPVKFTPYFSQSCRKAHWVLDDLASDLSSNTR